MSGCVDYRRHELWCEHPYRDTRWATSDGCSGLVCRACLEIVRGWPDEDKVQEIAVDRDGIPLCRADWTTADYIGHLIRTTERPAGIA